MGRTVRRTAAQILLIALVVSACGAAGGGPSQPISAGDKAGGRAATVLTLGWDGTPGDAGADYIEHFAAELDQVSGGRLTVEIKHRAAGDGVVRFDQEIAELVHAGDLDLGLVPTRAFDELGVRASRHSRRRSW